MPARWEQDEQGRGIADGRSALPAVEQLAAALALPDWIAERPETHLLPHLAAWCAHDASLSIESTCSDETGAYVLELTWHGAPNDLRGVRAAVFALIGQVAENATHVHQRRIEAGADADGPERICFEVVTGMLEGDTSFAPHGHVLRLNVARA